MFSRTPRTPRTSRRPRAAVPLLTAATSLSLLAATVPAPTPLGIGDPLFPDLGNPGYDVVAYDIAFRYGGDNTADLDARTRITARVTADRPLSRFNLDFAGGTVRSVSVGGRPARHEQAGEDVVVTPAAPAAPGRPLRVEVVHTSPTDPEENGGWIRTRDGLAMANQADAAHRVFPGNDHPSDKASFTFRVTAPSELTAVANGRLTGLDRDGDRTTWTYRGAHPMATELAQVSIGKSAVVRREGPRGLPVRDVVPAARAGKLEKWLAKTPGQIRWMEEQAGPYPFETYGVLAAEAKTGFALETQTLSLFERRFFDHPKLPAWYKESIMVHELAHQWFGNSVSPARWSDLWLNEGHATWYEWRYAEERGGHTLMNRVKQSYGASDGWRKKYGPPADLLPPTGKNKINIFRPIVYAGSAVVLYALRERIGEDAFGRLQRAWVERYRDGSASTDDFVALAGEVSGKDQGVFLRKWLYGRKTPPMPGHPDWKADKYR